MGSRSECVATQPDPCTEHLEQLARHGRPTAGLIAEALDIALTHDLTACDAAYVTLSARLGVPLITAHERLARALAGASLDVRWTRYIPCSIPASPNKKGERSARSPV
jgi:hypothetical protein